MKSAPPLSTDFILLDEKKKRAKTKRTEKDPVNLLFVGKKKPQLLSKVEKENIKSSLITNLQYYLGLILIYPLKLERESTASFALCCWSFLKMNDIQCFYFK